MEYSTAAKFISSLSTNQITKLISRLSTNQMIYHLGRYVFIKDFETSSSGWLKLNKMIKKSTMMFQSFFNFCPYKCNFIICNVIGESFQF